MLWPTWHTPWARPWGGGQLSRQSLPVITSVIGLKMAEAAEKPPSCFCFYILSSETESGISIGSLGLDAGAEYTGIRK
jgi:hypothetical protein